MSSAYIGRACIWQGYSVPKWRPNLRAYWTQESRINSAIKAQDKLHKRAEALIESLTIDNAIETARKLRGLMDLMKDLDAHEYYQRSAKARLSALLERT